MCKPRTTSHDCFAGMTNASDYFRAQITHLYIHRSIHSHMRPNTSAPLCLHDNTITMPISRRKPFKYKVNKTVKPPKTSRTEMSPILRAFVVGAISGMRGDYASQRDLASTLNRTQQGSSKLLQRVERKAEESSLLIYGRIYHMRMT